MSDLSSDSPVSRGTPTEEELRWIVNRIQVATKREGEVWRWLSEHVSGLLDAQAQLDAAAELLRAFVDDDECRLDHHGYCQTHRLEENCSTPRALQWLEGYDAARRALDSTSSPSEKQSVHPPVSSPPNQPGAR